MTITNFVEKYIEASLIVPMPIISKLPIINNYFGGVVPWFPVVLWQFKEEVIDHRHSPNIRPILTYFILDFVEASLFSNLIEENNIEEPELVLSGLYAKDLIKDIVVG